MFGLAICVLCMYPYTGFTSGQTAINFCPGTSIHRRVSVRLEESLIIDGSDAAIVSQDLPAGMITCECAITYYGLELPESPVDKDSESNTSHTLGKGRQFDEEAPLPKLLVKSRTDNISRCGKSVKVAQVGENDLHWLGCSSRDVEFEEIPRYGTMKMTLSMELPKPADTLYQVELKAVGQEILTPDAYNYHHVEVDLSESTDIVFEVQACNDANALLMKHGYDEDTDIYEIVIGGWNNSNSAIRTIKQQLPGVAQVWSEPLDCNVSKPFWISWANGEIQVGSGRIVGSDMFMSYVSNSAAVVNYIAVATGFGSSGIWRFGGATADFYVTCLPPVLPRTTQSSSSSRTTHAPSSSRTAQSLSSSRTTHAPSSSRTAQTPSSSRTTHAASPDLFTMKPPKDPNSNSLSDGSDNTAYEKEDTSETVNKVKQLTTVKQFKRIMVIEKTSQKIITTSLLSPEKKQNFILSEDVEESIADETNEYDNIHKENNTYDQLGLSEPLSITYLGLGSKSDCSNTNLKCEVNKSLESKCEPQDDYLKPGKVIPDYLEILPSLD